jgi:hypothetical protein
MERLRRAAQLMDLARERGTPEMADEAVVWRKSTKSGGSNCLQLAFVHDFILVRDSKDPSGPTLRFNRSEWLAFTAGLLAGEFDDFQ